MKLAVWGCILCPISTTALAQSSRTGTAAEAGSSVKDNADLSVQIKKQLYRTKNTIEVTAQVGGLLNHPYLGARRFKPVDNVEIPTPSTYHSSLSYYFSPRFGLSVDGTYFDTISNGTRRCVEYFYNSWGDGSVGTCAPTIDDSPENAQKTYKIAQNHLAQFSDQGDKAPNMGPAYPAMIDPIWMMGGSVVWVPVYGKLLIFMKWVRHFSAFMKVGGGITISDFYPLKTKDSTGHLLRGATPAQGSKQRYPGVKATETGEYGLRGRPRPQRLNVPTGSLGMGLKLHITQNLSLHGEGRALVLSGYAGGRTDLFYTLWVGLGFRI